MESEGVEIMEPKILNGLIEDIGDRIFVIHLLKAHKFLIKITIYQIVEDSEYDCELREISCRVRMYPTYLAAYKNFKNFCRNIREQYVPSLFHTATQRESTV